MSIERISSNNEFELYINIYHILVYKHNDFLLHYADKVHLLIRKEIMN